MRGGGEMLKVWPEPEMYLDGTTSWCQCDETFFSLPLDPGALTFSNKLVCCIKLGLERLARDKHTSLLVLKK
jgi:hypothetical protein